MQHRVTVSQKDHDKLKLTKLSADGAILKHYANLFDTFQGAWHRFLRTEEQYPSYFALPKLRDKRAFMLELPGVPAEECGSLNQLFAKIKDECASAQIKVCFPKSRACQNPLADGP